MRTRPTFRRQRSSVPLPFADDSHITQRSSRVRPAAARRPGLRAFLTAGIIVLSMSSVGTRARPGDAVAGEVASRLLFRLAVANTSPTGLTRAGAALLDRIGLTGEDRAAFVGQLVGARRRLEAAKATTPRNGTLAARRRQRGAEDGILQDAQTRARAALSADGRARLETHLREQVTPRITADQGPSSFRERPVE